MKIQTILFIAASSGICLTGCLSSGESPLSPQGDGSLTSTERERDPIEVDCRSLGYQSLQTLTSDILQIPDDAMFFDGSTLASFMSANEGALGGQGVSEVRDCSLMYFKATTQLGNYSCHWLAENNPSLLFPSGLSDFSHAFSTLTGLTIDDEERSTLEDLANSMTSFDSEIFSSLNSKKMTAVCVAIFSSLGTQSL